MKFYGSIAAGVCTTWLRFEPDPDQNPDHGSRHVFKIARRIELKVMDRLQWYGVVVFNVPLDTL